MASIPQTHHYIPAQQQNDTVLHLHNPLPSSNINCPSCPMQRHLLQQILASQIRLTKSQHTTSPPSQTHPILKYSPVLATHFTLHCDHSAATLHSTHSAEGAKSNAAFNTQLCLILHSCSLPVWQYTLNATQTSMNQQAVSSLLTAHAHQCIASSNAPLYTCSITK